MKKLLLCCVAALAVVGCQVGQQARTQALAPVVKSTWPAVKQDVDLGIQSDQLEQSLAPAVVAFDTSVTAGHPDLQVWLVLAPEADHGVTQRVRTGEISPGVGESRRERIKQFDAAVRKMNGQ
jgi:hypothetical protein